MNNKTLLWSIVSILTLASCHKQRLTKSISTISPEDSVAVVISTDSVKIDTVAATLPLNIQEFTFDYLTTKSKFSFKGAKQDLDNTNVNIRIKKDSLIWISITGVGFEVARGIIAQDSIVFMDKIHKDYFVFSYEQLSRQYNFNLNFGLLQSIILGNLPFPPSPEATAVQQDEFLLLKQKEGRLDINNYIGQSNLKLTRLEALEVPTSNTFSLDYEDFKSVSSFLFPFSSRINLDVRSEKDQRINTTRIQLKHSKVEIVNQSPGFPFNIPGSYTRKR
jgi:hypothetical protein